MQFQLHTPFIAGGMFVLLFVVEKLFPLRESKAGLLARVGVNGCVSALAFLVAALVVGHSSLSTLIWTSALCVDARAINRLEENLSQHGLSLRRARLQTLQINVGPKCNQACRHC